MLPCWSAGSPSSLATITAAHTKAHASDGSRLHHCGVIVFHRRVAGGGQGFCRRRFLIAAQYKVKVLALTRHGSARSASAIFSLMQLPEGHLAGRPHGCYGLQWRQNAPDLLPL